MKQSPKQLINTFTHTSNFSSIVCTSLFCPGWIHIAINYSVLVCTKLELTVFHKLESIKTMNGNSTATLNFSQCSGQDSIHHTNPTALNFYFSQFYKCSHGTVNVWYRSFKCTTESYLPVQLWYRRIITTHLKHIILYGCDTEIHAYISESGHTLQMSYRL